MPTSPREPEQRFPRQVTAETFSAETRSCVPWLAPRSPSTRPRRATEPSLRSETLEKRQEERQNRATRRPAFVQLWRHRVESGPARRGGGGRQTEGRKIGSWERM